MCRTRGLTPLIYNKLSLPTSHTEMTWVRLLIFKTVVAYVLGEKQRHEAKSPD